MTEPAELQHELEAAEAAAGEARSLRSRLESLVQLQAATDAELRATRVKLGDERQDVAFLESFSPTRIRAALRGTRLDDLSREQAEVQAAEYAVARLESRLKSLRDDEYLLRARMSDLGAKANELNEVTEAFDAATAAAQIPGLPTPCSARPAGGRRWTRGSAVG